MKKLVSLLVYFVCIYFASVGFAQKEYIVSTIPYTIADSWNVEIKLSPGFLTEINFPSPIRNPGSGDFGSYELIGKAGDTSVWLRPKASFTATDLWVPMEDGKTAVFYITYDDNTKISRKYVPADTVTERQLAQDTKTQAEEPTSNLPSWIHFSYDATLQGKDLVVAYSLKNNGLDPVTNDRLRLRILANGNPLEYELASGERKNRLMSGEGEDGTLTVRNVPPNVGDLRLEWLLVAQGAGAFYRIDEPLVLQ
jgi:hypothetical protein